MSSGYPRFLAALFVTVLPVLIAGALLTPTQAQPPRAGAQATTARTLPRQAAPASTAALSAAPVADPFPASMSEDFEGAWPSAGWTLQDYGTSGGQYLFGQRDCNPQNGANAAWAGGGGANGASLPCGAEYVNDVYSVATYGPFDLTNATSSVMSYAFTGVSERNADQLYIAASIDDYYYCGAAYSGDYSAGYVQGTLDLSDLQCAGQPPSLLGRTNVTIALMFISDYSITDVGFQVDDLVLTTVENAPPTATNTATATATSTPTETPTSTPDGPTATPTNTPEGPTATPTDAPTSTPTDVPTSAPTSTPTETAPITTLNLSVGAIDASQAVQTADNSVPLVAGRPVIARVTVNVQNSGEAVLGVTARLRGARNGVELPSSPLAPFNNGGSIVAPLTPNREDFGTTLNFQIPAEWTTGGPLVIWVEVNPNRSVAEGNFGDNRSADLTLNFVTVPTLEIMLVPIAYQPNGVGPIMRPDLTQNNQGLTNVQNIFPIADVRTTLHNEYLFTGNLSGNGWVQLLNEITAVRNRELGGAARTSKVLYYGVVPQAAVAGQGSFTAGIGWVGGNLLTSLGLEAVFGVAAHEIGHNLGLNHAPCGVAGDPNYPFADGRTGDVGVDVFERNLHSATDKDFMSYCQPIWVSAFHYSRMLQVLRQTTTVAAQPAAIEDGLLVSGSISSDTRSAQLNPSVPMGLTETTPAGGAGAYRIELRDTSGALQYSYAFTPQEIDSHTAAIGSGFSFVVPLIADLGRVQLWKDGTLLANQLASQVQPDLTASFVNSASAITVNWSASSPDNTPVTVSLRYTADNGLSWRVLALNLSGTSFTIDKRNLPGGNQGRLEVSAGNTTQTRSVQLSIGAIGNKAPVVSIAGTPNVQQYRGQPLLLQAVALDLEDGYLQDKSLSWTNERGQVLGTGETLSLPSGLPLGTYTLTLTATDSAGATSQDSVRVSVIMPPPVSLLRSYTSYLPFLQWR